MLRDEGFAVIKEQLDGELVVGASLMMSSFCYSIFRLDPYVGCQHSCSYCYTRFLPGHRRRLRAITNYAKQLRNSLGRWLSSGVPLPPFRLSALTDPFQPIEEKFLLTLKILKLALEQKIPLIISTKSALIARPPWLDLVKELVGEGLGIVQLSVAFLDDEIAKKVEVGAPPPSVRFKTAELLSGEGVPVVLRMQPLIPFLNSSEEFFEEYGKVAKSVGAKHVIMEALRISSWHDLKPFSGVMREADFASLVSKSLWELYPRGSHKHPRREWRRQAYATASERLSKLGLKVGLCREGFFSLNTAPDCCGIYLLREKVLRETLYEKLYGLKPGYKYISREDATKLPLPSARRKLIEHYSLLQRVLVDKELLWELIDQERV